MDSRGRLGSLALLWRKEIDIELKSMSLHHVDVMVRSGIGNEEWRCTGFYGWLEVHNRHLSWKLLETLSTHFAVPWLCFGDFNEIIFPT